MQPLKQLDSMSNTGALKSSGLISTQVMDLTRGSPLGQITVGLFLMRNKKWVQLAERSAHTVMPRLMPELSFQACQVSPHTGHAGTIIPYYVNRLQLAVPSAQGLNLAQEAQRNSSFFSHAGLIWPLPPQIRQEAFRYQQLPAVEYFTLAPLPSFSDPLRRNSPTQSHLTPGNPFLNTHSPLPGSPLSLPSDPLTTVSYPLAHLLDWENFNWDFVFIVSNMTQSQESRVSSTQDSLSLRPTEDSISSVSALVNKLSSCSGIYENEKSSYSSSGDEKKMQALLPWIKNFNSLCQSVVGCRSLKRLEKLLQIFWKNMSDPVKKSLKMTNRTAKLKKYMSEVLLFFHMSYLDLQETTLRKVLNFVRPSTAPMYTMLYVRYLLAYKLWKKVVGNAEEKKRINKLAAVKLSAPTELTEKVVLWPSVLPKVPKSKKNVTLFLMQAKFDLKKSCQIGIDSSGNLFDGIWSLLCNVDSNTSDGTKTISPMGVKSERHISSTQKYKPKEKAPKKLKMKLINENKKPSSSNKVKKKTKCKKKNAIKPSDTLSVLSVKKGIKLPNNTTRKKKKNKFVKERLSVNFLTTALGTLSSSLSKPSMRDFISTSTSHSFSSSEEQSSSFGSISASLGSLPSPMERFTSAPLENVSAPVPIHSSPSSSDSLSSLPPPLEDLQIMSPSGISPLPPLDSELQRPAHLENNDLRKSFDSPSPSVPCPDTVAPSVASLTPSHPSAPLSPLTEDLQNKLELMDTEEGVQRMQEQETSKVAESNIPDVPEQSVVNKDIQNVSELTPPNISGVKLNCVSEIVIQTTEALLALGVSEEMTLCVPELPQVEIKAEPEVENINKVIHAKPQALCVQKQNNVQQDSKIDLHNEISNLNITHSNDETTHNADQGSVPMQDGRLNIKVDVDSMENRDLSHETEISIANVKSSDTQYFDAPSNEVISEQTEICLQEEVVSQVEEEISTHSVEDGVSAIQINDTEHLYSSVSNHSFYHSEEHSTNLPEKTFTKSVINSNRTIDAEVALDKEVINRETAQIDVSHVTPPMAIIPNSERNILFSTEDQCYAKKQSDLLTSNISKNTSDCIDRSNSESCPSNSATVGISLSELERNKLNKPQQQKINQTNITKKSIIHFDEQGSTSTNSLKGINANNSENNPITSTIETSVHKIMDSSLDFISANSKDVPIEVSVANKTVTNFSNSIKITNSITPNSIKEIPLIDVSSNEDSAGTLDSSDSVSDLATKIERTNVLDDSFVTNGNADSSSVILASNSALRCDFKSVISSQTTTVRLDPCDRLRAPTSSNNMINKTSHVDNEAVPITVNSKHLNQEKSTGLVSLTEDDGHSSDEPQIIGEERYCSADSSIKNESRSRSAFSDSQRGYYVEYDSDVEILEDIINNGINNNSGTSEGEEVISNVSNQTPRDDHGVFGLGPGELVMEVIGMSGPVSVIYSGSYAPREDLGQSSVDSESQPVHFDETEHFVDTTNLLDDTPRDRERDDYTYGRNSQDCLYRDVMLTGNRLNESGDTNYESFDFESYPLFQEDFMEGDEDDDIENTLVEDDLDSPIREGGRKYRSKNFALDSEKENSDGSPTSQGDIENVHTNNLTEENRRLFLAQQSERDNISVKTKPTDKSFPTVRFSDVNRYYPATLPSVQVDDVRNETKHDPPIKLSRTAKSLAAANEESAYLGRVTTVQLKQLPNQADPLLNLGQSIISKENLDAKLLGNESPAIPKRGSPAYNGQFHTQFRNTNIQRTVAENEALKSQDEELLKKIEESLSESARTKQEGIKDNFDDTKQFSGKTETSKRMFKTPAELKQISMPEDFVSSTVNLKSEPCLMPIPVLIPLDSKIDRTFNLGKRDCSGNPVNPPCEKLETKQGLDLTINKEIKSRGRPKGVRGVGPNRDRGGRRKSPSLDENQERVENSPSKIYDGCKERVEKSPTQTFEKSYDRFKERVEKSLINCVNKSHTKCKERADKLSTECIDINEAECKERVGTSTSPLLNFSPNLNSVGRNRGGFRGSGRKPSSAGHDSFNNSRGRRKIRGPRSRSPSNAPSLPNRSLIRGHGGGRGPRRRRSSSSSPSPPTLTRIHGSGKRPKKKMNRSSLDLGGGNRNTRLRSSSVSPSPPPILSRGHSVNMGKKKLSPSPTSSRCDSPMPNLHMEFCPHRITRQMTANLSSSPCRPVKEDSSDEGVVETALEYYMFWHIYGAIIRTKSKKKYAIGYGASN
uniref:Uncharacterized protein n=1 Tax=Timema monikensis TaxID=170555 RepID=A0A7R9E0D2_9NEOP|nr:unnamed protein product [Timema monikensis]